MDLSSRALAFASRWFDPAVVHRTFEPLVADWQREWHDSLASRRSWVTIRGLTAFVCAVVVSSPSIVAATSPVSIVAPIAIRISVFCAIVGGLINIPMVNSLMRRSVDQPWLATLILLALPGSLMIAFPFSMIGAVDAIQRDAYAPQQVKRVSALKLALFGALFMAVVGGFLVPMANRQWLRVSTPVGWNTPEPAFGELTTLALLTHPERRTAIVPRQYTRAGEIRRTLINRTTASLLPALLVWLRWTMVSRQRRRAYWPPSAAVLTGLSASAVILVSLLAGFLEYRLEWQPGTGLWAPVGMLIAWILFEQRHRVDPQEV